MNFNKMSIMANKVIYKKIACIINGQFVESDIFYQLKDPFL
jgi:hypothetical protein